MSATTTPPATAAAAIAQATNTTTLVQKLQTAAVNGARDVPDTVRAVAVLDPSIAAYVQGKSLLGSKTIIAPIVTHVVTWAVGYWALGWDAATTESICGLISIALMWAARYVATVPITSWLPKRSS